MEQPKPIARVDAEKILINFLEREIKSIKKLKNDLVRGQAYETSANLRDIERFLVEKLYSLDHSNEIALADTCIQRKIK